MMYDVNISKIDDAFNSKCGIAWPLEIILDFTKVD